MNATKQQMSSTRTWSEYTDRATSGRFTVRYAAGRVHAFIDRTLICEASTFEVAKRECERYALAQAEG